MKNIKMTRAMRGSLDGVTVTEYAEGWSGELPEALADVFIAAGAAVEVRVEQAPERREESRKGGKQR